MKDEYQHHISQPFNKDLLAVRNHLMEMGGQVEKQVADALSALLGLDTALADAIIDTERNINQLEMTIDEECTRILALRQPAASDLRMIVSISKAVADLERVGDESAKIARLTKQLAEEDRLFHGSVELRHIGNEVRQMLHDALDAFARFDANLAMQTAARDHSVDMEYRTAMRSLVTVMMEDPRSISHVLNILWALRALERVGDHARNISEQVIYLVKGKDVRHLSLDQMQREVNS